AFQIRSGKEAVYGIEQTPVPESPLRDTSGGRDGAFTDDEVILQEDIPTTLTNVNHDNTAYQFRIEGLVSGQSLPASDDLKVSFTTPSPDTYTGQLLDADGDSVIAEISVTVHSAGGVER